MALALNGASREDAGAFLKDQRALIADQRQHLHEQLKQLKLGIFSQRISIALKGLAALVGLMAVIALGVVVWDASQADGLVVEAFSVPPSLAASGLSGDAVSQDITDRVNAIRGGVTHSLSASRGARQEGSDDVKVEIPETGISLTQAWRYLKLWLGNERHVRGSLRPDGDGRIRMTVALEGEPPASFAGTGGELDKIEQRAAEHVYAGIEPVNYLIYLDSNYRFDEAMAALPAVIDAASTPEDRADGFGITADFIPRIRGDFALALARARIARLGAPKRFTGYLETARADTLLRHDEDRLLQAAAILTLKKQDQIASVQGRGWDVITAQAQADHDGLRGDYSTIARACTSYCTYAQTLVTDGQVAAMLHDPETSRGLIAEALAVGGNTRQDLAEARYDTDVATNDWQAAVRDANAYLSAVATEATVDPGYRGVWKTNIGEPRLAEAEAHSGNIAGALALIASTPLDCDDCVRMRGRIAALNRDWTGAARWFQMVSARSPDIPFADADWGAMLLTAGDAGGAIAKFQSANQKGPHFADPLEGWGEALMAKNQSHLALAKFAEAEKYAPNWGRLHLKWGEALVYAGKPDEAKNQFSVAARLDLVAADKAALRDWEKRT
jgi:tetratricopeptide (TPR) repeat protein